MTFSIDFSDGKRFAAGMAQAEPIMRQELLTATDRITLQGEAFAKGLAPVRTGHLRRSIAAKPAVWAGGAVGEYGTATPYARYVEEGRGPVVARGRALRFTIGGQVLFRKRVGPAAARPFIGPSVERLRPIVPREYGAALDRVLAKIGGA